MDFSAFPPLAALLDGAHALLAGLADVLEPLAGSRRQSLRLATTPDSAAASSMLRMMSWLPFLSVGVSAFLPLAAVLYVTTSTVWTYLERTVLRRVLPGGALNPATA